MTDIDRLSRFADRGTPQGADQVLESAHALRDQPTYVSSPPGMPSPRGRVL